MTCSRCEELEEEIAYLKSELGMTKNAAAALAIQTATGVTVGEAHVLLSLHNAKGRPHTREQVINAYPSRRLDGRSDDSSDSMATTVICRIRSALGYDTITTARSYGYSLSPSGIARISAILGAA